MSQTCQHCGATSEDDARVMCPSCGRRMRPRDAAPEPTPPPTQPPPPPAPAAPPPYGIPLYGVPPMPPPPWAGGPLPYGASPYGSPNVRPAVFFDRTVTQRSARLTVAFRLILALPHFVLLAFYTVGAAVAVIAAWFAALFVARVPTGLYDFLGRYFAYYARVTGYTAMLTDRWPTLSNDDPYPIVLRLPGPGRLNRAAVFFRYILAIPASIVLSVVGVGAEILAVVSWFVVLIAGRMPAPLFDAYASTIRYYMRAQVYVSLLTSTYPAGLFGDPDDGMDAVGAAAASEGPRTPVVESGARRLIVVFIVIGAIANIAPTVAGVVSGSSRINAAIASSELSDAYHALDFGSFTACNTPATSFTCYVETARQDAQVVASFQDSIGRITFPADVHDEVVKLNAAVQEFRNDFVALAGAKDRNELRTILATLDLQGDSHAFDSAVSELGQRLDSES